MTGTTHGVYVSDYVEDVLKLETLRRKAQGAQTVSIPKLINACVALVMRENRLKEVIVVDS
jgi:hypothetical protein